MKPLVFTLESDGKIHLTREELEKLLAEAYEDGRENGKRVEYILYYPSAPVYPTISPTIWCDTNTTITPPYTFTCTSSNSKEACINENSR